MAGLFPKLRCILFGCVFHQKTTCVSCGKMRKDREELLKKTLKSNAVLRHENKSHMARIRQLKQKLKK